MDSAIVAIHGDDEIPPYMLVLAGEHEHPEYPFAYRGHGWRCTRAELELLRTQLDTVLGENR